MLKKKWDAALETGLESGIFKHDHKGWFQTLIPKKSVRTVFIEICSDFGIVGKSLKLSKDIK